jgi:protein SCO1
VRVERRSLLVLCLLAVGLFAGSCLGQVPGTASRFVGTDLGVDPAPAFDLIDQQGQPVTLAGLTGKAVALTFLYTSCPDICPVITNKFGFVHDALGEKAQAVVFAAITVDPERDTPARLRQYLDAQGLAGKMMFLTGDRGQLETVWSAYHILVARSSQDQATYTVTHSDAVYLLDKAGRLRLLMHTDLAPGDLQRNLESLLAEQ